MRNDPFIPTQAEALHSTDHPAADEPFILMRELRPVILALVAAVVLPMALSLSLSHWTP